MKQILFTVAIGLVLSSGTFPFAETSKKGYYTELWDSMPHDAKVGFVAGLQAVLSLYSPSRNDSETSLADQMKVLWSGAQCSAKYSPQQTITLIDAYIIGNPERAKKSTLGLIAMEAIQSACLPSSK